MEGPAAMLAPVELALVEKDKANLRKFFHSCKSKTPSDAFFVNSATFCKFCHSPAPLYFSSPHQKSPISSRKWGRFEN